MKFEAFSRTKSVCPHCLRVLEAERAVGEDGCVYLLKRCPEHGEFSCLIWEGPLEEYLAWNTAPGGGNAPPVTVPAREGCPDDCGLCSAHESAGCCVLLELTKRCNLNCPVCFASAGGGEAGPTLEELAALYDMLAARGGPFNIQLSGGEPTLRGDLPEIVALGRERGFTFFQLNTNGLRLAEEEGFAARLRGAGVSCAFLQFDGLRDETHLALRGRALAKIKRRAIRNCALAGLPVVLVPTLAPGVNVDEIGAILRFALENAPHVRGVHFQPISYFGRCALPAPERRLTIPRVLREIEAQTEGLMRRADFAGGGAESPYCSFHASWRVNPDGSLRALGRRASCCRSADARDFVAGRWGAQAAPDAGEDGFDRFLREAAESVFTVSGMVFQDADTLDLERLRRCHICEADPGRGMVPFCAYNLTARDGRALYRR
ncbi:MAG TPA: radical SAM protein [Candidatus Scatomorpha merdipullorum]|uniref:Radical SAM protein n=1 Tax=Candidatus Scatomorpha merdipullorum TaxID=2840927 RepID=A0A9D1JUF4_9FIRM|nr:radical SAM protein [Candidatus Scatomorpha merdipullorum]